MRKALQYLPFFLPFIGYAVYVVVWRVLGRDASWRTAPWMWLATAGLVLTAAGFLVVRVLEPSPGTDVDYVPPHLEDGEVRPAEIRPADER